MKKYFFVAASAALVLSSCSNEIEQVTELGNKKQEIKVSTYTPGMTRANAVQASDESLQEKGFWMYAVNNTTPLINDVYSYSDDKWSPAGGPYFWPEGGVSFYAVYMPTLPESNPISSDLEMSVMLEDAKEDIMVAKIDDLTVGNNGSTEVELDFEHILAEVEIQVKGASSNFRYRLYGISLSAVSSSTYDLSTSSFGTGERAVFEIKSQTVTDEGAKFDGYGEDGTNYSGATADVLSQRYVKYGETLMVVPGVASLTIGYDIYLGDEEITTNTGKTVDVTLVAGKKNIIQVTLDSDAQLPITVSAKTISWTDKTEDATLK